MIKEKLTNTKTLSRYNKKTNNRSKRKVQFQGHNYTKKQK